ncbi:MAG: ferredoxin reductase [Actinomycetes bacterium]
MAGTAVLERLGEPLLWRVATVVRVASETSRARTITLEVSGWPGHRPGQHLDVRLTAEDGYQAQRSYSIASAPSDEHVRLTVERLDDGEVSPYLTDELRPGDGLEVRGPIGGYFAWDGGPRPVFLAAGGSGVVPLMAMLRHRATQHIATPVRLLYSARSLDDVIYREELDRLATPADGPGVAYTLTRSHPPGWTGHTRRVDEAMLAETAWTPDHHAVAFVCGPTAFVETTANALTRLGHAPADVRTERFGPTGG